MDFLRRNTGVDLYELFVNLFESRVDILDVGLVLNNFVTHHMHDDFSHPARRAISRTLKDDVLHGPAAQVLYALLAQNPGYCISDIAFAAPIRADDGGNPVTSEEYFGVVREGFEPGNLEAFQFEHARNRLLLPKPVPRIPNSGGACTGVPI